jgi:Holliday junction resolvasome RuvABC DNA-binding subunit
MVIIHISNTDANVAALKNMGYKERKYLSTGTGSISVYLSTKDTVHKDYGFNSHEFDKPTSIDTVHTINTLVDLGISPEEALLIVRSKKQ